MSKGFLRTLLFSSSKRGRIIESIYVTLQCDDISQDFTIWTRERNQLARGSGLFVGETEVEANHHFLMLRAKLCLHLYQVAVECTCMPICLGIGDKGYYFPKY